MRRGVGLYALGLLCLYSSVFGQEAVKHDGVLVFCDDPVVEKAVTSALHKFNEGVVGQKLALYQILTATKSDTGSDSVYSLQFTSRRSDCPAASSKLWTDCNYLPGGRKKPISCNATVQITEIETDTKEVYCMLDDFIVPQRAPCMGCPMEVAENSEDLRVPLIASLSKYNSMSEHSHLFTVHSVGHATRQVVAGLRYKLRFDMRKTICSKAEHKDLSVVCVPDEDNVEFSNCNSTVDVAPWRLEAPQTNLECEPGALPMIFTRRRPPGWSPLRNFLFDAVPSPPPNELTPEPPTSAAVKEESSEEDTTGSKQAGSPDAAAASDDPFHCPSKPWKPFKPVRKGVLAAPTDATPDGTSAPVEGAFSDLDLLA